MNEYIITFGYNQNPGIGKYTVIQAENASEARRKINEITNGQWSFMYNSKYEAGVYDFNLVEIAYDYLNDDWYYVR